ncbi:phytoene desaturase family protein, partial [Sulfuracidifex metallicus]|uniref:phytoene desaturase family protein n=1 Tax=Sulfuracidifex metallicus TaxID=47303 RepID=UPI0022726D4C|nr:phytoene desaturase [Sulfuracidifex metallicus]
NMDYHYADTLLPMEYTMRGESYWERRKLSPSAVLAYVGVEGEVNAPHHGIFINGNWKLHFDSISKGNEPDPENMSYYVSYRKATDSSLKGKDLVFLIPVSPGLLLPNYQDYVRKVIDDFKAKTRSSFHIKYEKVYRAVNFEEDYNAYKGSAFGLSHTLDQTGPFRLPMKNRKLSNLFYVGQYTQPGIGVPMVTISAMILGDKILKNWSKK